MLNSRIIPCLLVKNKGLVKTIRFKKPKYVGDPINAVKIFNEKEVDELIVIDIDATIEKREPDYKMIENIAAECRMPLCYGGGIKTPEQAKRIFSLGVEKIGISSIVHENPYIVRRIADEVGCQSVVVIFDVKRKQFSDKYEIWTHNSTVNTKKNPFEFALEMERQGAGEIVINSIDHDGIMKGYDLKLINKIYNTINIPLTALGGAGSLSDMKKLIDTHKIIGAASGSLFVFKGIYKAVLINYPSKKEKNAIMK